MSEDEFDELSSAANFASPLRPTTHIPNITPTRSSFLKSFGIVNDFSEDDFDELYSPANFKSPLRPIHFRACKSPHKPNAVLRRSTLRKRSSSGANMDELMNENEDFSSQLCFVSPARPRLSRACKSPNDINFFSSKSSTPRKKRGIRKADSKSSNDDSNLPGNISSPPCKSPHKSPSLLTASNINQKGIESDDSNIVNNQIYSFHNLKPPSRQSISRACKSPHQPNIISSNSLTPHKKRAIRFVTPEDENNELDSPENTKSLLKATISHACESQQELDSPPYNPSTPSKKKVIKFEDSDGNDEYHLPKYSKSPLRPSLHRACKSPHKPDVDSFGSSSPSKKRAIKFEDSEGGNDELDLSKNFKSPLRPSVYRACKSPHKPGVVSLGSSSPSKKKVKEDSDVENDRMRKSTSKFLSPLRPSLSRACKSPQKPPNKKYTAVAKLSIHPKEKAKEDPDGDKDEIRKSPSKFLSPLRPRLSRACKSPQKSPYKKDGTNTKSSTPQKKKGSPVRRSADITTLLEKFPLIDENFVITRKTGEGTFSKVYLAKLRIDPTQIFALKHLIPTISPGRIENELKCLQILGGTDNVLPVNSVLRNGDHIVFLLPYIPHAKFIDYMPQMNAYDIQKYMYHLFVALKHVHCLGIIHRDVKPSNFLYSRQLDRFFLIDFGLAMPVPGSSEKILNDYTNYSSSKKALSTDAKSGENLSKLAQSNPKNRCRHTANRICDCCKGRPRQTAPRAGTPGFRSPEVLMRYPHQTTAVDMWAAGVILLSILSRRYPFFKAKDDMEALTQMMALFGSDAMKKMANSIDKELICMGAVKKEYELKLICEKLARRKCMCLKDERDCISESGNLMGSNCASGTVLNSVEQLNSIIENIHRKKKRSACLKRSVNFEPLPKNSKKENGVIINGTELISECHESEKKIVTDERTRKLSQNIPSTNNSNECDCIPNTAYNLLERLLELDPHKRISAEEALKHPFFIHDR